MQPWVQGEWMALDFETTGTNPREARPVEVAWLVVNSDGDIVHEYCTLVNADVEIPEEASKVHGITTERIKNEGVPVAEALEAVCDRIYNNTHLPLVIYNVPYDWPLLKAESQRQGYNLDVHPCPLFLDPLLIDRTFDKYRKGSRTLSTIASVHKVKLDDAHNARADAHAAARAMRAMINPRVLFAQRSLEEIQLLQTQWFNSWKLGINAHWKRQGDQREVTNNWPE